MKNSRNMTGLYVSGFIQEGYLPPREKRSTIPSTLYRGHVVKLARGPNSNPHRNSVGKYPMHSLNSGFNGSMVPLKDKKSFEKFAKMKAKANKNVSFGKWTNFPMLVEVRKVGGTPVPEHVLQEASYSQSSPMYEADQPQPSSQSPSRFTSASYYRDKGDDMFYESMYQEIENIVSKQDQMSAVSRTNLKKILSNSSDPKLSPRVTTAFQSNKRASSSVGYPLKASSNKHVLPPRPFTTTNSLDNPSQSSLLLPVPYVSQYNIVEKVQNPRNTTPVGPWVSKSQSSLKSISTFSGLHPGMWHSVPSQYYHSDKKQTNIGVTNAQKVHRLLKVNIHSSDSLTFRNLSKKTDENEISKSPHGGAFASLSTTVGPQFQSGFPTPLLGH